MNFLLRTPFFRITISLIIGIVLFNYIVIPDIYLYIGVGIGLLILLVSFLIKQYNKQFKYRWLFGASISLLILIFAQFICKFKVKESEFTFIEQKKVYIAEVLTSPIEKAKSYRCEIRIQRVLNNNKWENAQGHAIVYFEKQNSLPNLLIADKILIRTVFKKPVGAENPDGFNYSEYLSRNGINATSYLTSESWRKISLKPAFSIKRISNNIRNSLLAIYSRYGIVNDEFAVLSALTLGYTDELNPDLRANYSATGAMHILSVSGLHVGIVYIVIAFLLRFLSKNRFQSVLKAVLIVLFLWTYAFVTGLSPSVIRSALMFSFVAIASGLERKSQIFNTVFMSAFLMLIYNPNFIYDIGFQLSYAAVISILIFQKPIASLLPVQNKILRWLRDLFTVSIAAQLGTVPFTLYYFQQFPTYFLLTNLIAIPISTLIIYLAMILLLASPISVLATYVSIALKWLIFSMNFSISKIHELPFSVLSIAPGFFQSLLILISIAGFSLYIYSKKYLPLFISLLAIISYGGMQFSTLYKTMHSEQIIVYSSQKALHINFITNGKNIIYTSDSSEIKNIGRNFWKRNQFSPPEFKLLETQNKNNYLFFMHKKIVVANKKLWLYFNPGLQLHADILIIGNKIKPKINKLFENIKPKTVIVDKTISKWYTDAIKKKCLENKINFYSIAESGAYKYVRNK